MLTEDELESLGFKGERLGLGENEIRCFTMSKDYVSDATTTQLCDRSLPRKHHRRKQKITKAWASENVVAAESGSKRSSSLWRLHLQLRLVAPRNLREPFCLNLDLARALQLSPLRSSRGSSGRVLSDLASVVGDGDIRSGRK
ncbi:hypothetical protein ACFX14_011927 [Malus domestica]